MILKNSVFDSFISNYATQHERTAAEGLSVINVHLDKDYIQAQVEDDKIYFTSINFNSKKVTTAVCTCFHDKAGACRHVIATLKEVDQLMAEDEVSEEKSSLELVKEKSSFTILNQQVLSVELGELQKISVSPSNASKWHARLDLREAEMAPNFIAAKVFQGYEDDYLVRITQGTNQIHLTCKCYNPSSKLCSHMYHTFLEINREDALQLPFNQTERIDFLQKHAVKMGLAQAENLDELFELSFSYNRLHVNPKYTMLSLSTSEKEALKKQLLPHFEFPKAKPTSVEEILIVEESNYNKQLVFHLCEAQVTKSGELKTPIDKVDLNSKMRSTKNPEELLFFAALLQQDPYKEQVGLYEDILRNPLGFKTYFHIDGKQSKRIFLKNLEPIKLEKAQVQAQINVKQSGDFYVLTCEVKVENSWFSTRNVNLLGTFFLSKDVLSWIQNETILQIIKFFKTKNHEVFIHKSQFATFREEFLEPLEDAILVKYAFVKKAPAKLIKEKSLDQVAEYLIYLADSDDYITITPVIMYGETEVNVLSKRTVLTENPDGTLYSIERKEQVELEFIQNIKSQHPAFEWEQQTPFFYLHKQEFLDRGWFLEAFENWRAKGYSILGFNQLKNNRYNSNKIKVLTTVKSGIDWFDAEMKINFGKVSISLKDIQKAVTNRSKYVELGDGTIGILPDEWIQKFTNYFRNSEINGDHLKIHKSNFQIIDDLFDQEVVDREVLQEIHQLKAKLASFKKIQQVQIPNALNATLRDYQKEGLNWLNFLDEFGFGGILADDMGLGKTIQMIAFMLLQLEKGRTEPNLVVVPTSLLFNWQRELERFAPSMKFIVLHGTNRATLATDFSQYNVVITTYGTMLSDIEFLKKVHFNLLILDESQAIKNPSSKRYKAARLLKGRQRIAVTGTPVENNTFDLYAQLSFVMPGLLGSAKRFSDDYAIPIDKFQDTWRARELQQKVHPFILRRTKDQVAKELPEKTEMVLYCEMDTEQQRVYDTYKLEFQKYLAGLSMDELHSSSLHVLQGLTKLRQICNSPALLSDDEFYGDQSAKLTVLMEQIEQLKSDHKIVVFSQFVGMLELIKPKLDQAKIKYAYLTGQTKDREAQVKQFQEDDETRVFLVSLKAGGTGLNLTEASYVVLVDPWWNPAVENQAIDRAHRIGQTNKVVAIRLITPNTIEEKIMELQQRKRELTNELIHTDTTILKQLSKEELLQIL